MFSQRLKELREEHHTTQQELAELLHVTRATISGYETKGQNPDFEKLLLLCNYFDVTTDYLLGASNIRKRVGSLTSNFSKEDLEVLNYFKKLNKDNKYLILAEMIKFIQEQNEQVVPPKKIQDNSY